MKLTGLHLLLTYRCNLECEHCFVWGSPWQSGTMTLQDVSHILKQGKDLGTIEWIYFEGGEPFLYYPILVKGIQEAAHMGFKVGVVSNGYWATQVEDAVEWLAPMTGLVQDLSVSSDLYHSNETPSRKAEIACAAARHLGIPTGVISIAEPEAAEADVAIGQLPQDESRVMHRGRAAERLSGRAAQQSWEQFTECPYEDLDDPGRVHVDPLGNLHLCQGITIGNLFKAPLTELWAAFDPDSHPIAGPLLEGGPAALVRSYGLRHAASYADACHLCYEARKDLRARFPEILAPDQMYGVPNGA